MMDCSLLRASLLASAIALNGALYIVLSARTRQAQGEQTLLLQSDYKYIIKLLNDITVFTCLVKVRKTNSLKLGPAALRP